MNKMQKVLKKLVVLVMAIFISVTTYATTTSTTEVVDTITFVIKYREDFKEPTLSTIWDDTSMSRYDISKQVKKKNDNWEITLSGVNSSVPEDLHMSINIGGHVNFVSFNTSEAGLVKELAFNYDGDKIDFNMDYQAPDGKLQRVQIYKKTNSVSANGIEYMKVAELANADMQNIHLPQGEEYVCQVMAYDQSNQYDIYGPIVNNQFTMSGDTIEQLHIKHNDTKYGTTVVSVIVTPNYRLSSYTGLNNKNLQGPNEMNVYVNKEVIESVHVTLLVPNRSITYSLKNRGQMDFTTGPKSMTTDVNFTININFGNRFFKPDSNEWFSLGGMIDIRDSYGNYIRGISCNEDQKYDNVAHVIYTKGNETFSAIGRVNGGLSVKTPVEPGEYDFLISIDETLPIYIPSAQGKIKIGESTNQSSNANLSCLIVDQGTLTPEFNANTTDYKVTVDNSVSSIVVGAAAADAKTTVTGTGEKALVVGDNTIQITTKAENGNSKTYTIIVTRQGNLEGWVQDLGNWYYYVDGKPVIGWANIGGYWRYFNEAGILANGWTYIDGYLRYFNEDGMLTIGWANISGYWRYFDENGVLANGWTYIDGYLRYFDENGILTIGWTNISGYWRYFDENGVLANGWTYIDGYLRYFDENGILTIGWANIGGYWRYFNEDGVIYLNGWYELNGYERYFDENGIMATNTIVDGWVVNEDGIKVTLLS